MSGDAGDQKVKADITISPRFFNYLQKLLIVFNYVVPTGQSSNFLVEDLLLIIGFESFFKLSRSYKRG